MKVGRLFVLWSIVSLLSAAPLVMVGCGGRGTYVKPSLSALPVQNAQSLGSARYRSEAPGGECRIEVYYQGYGVRRVSGSWPQPSIRIQFSCDNDCDLPMVFDTTEATLVDNRGDVIRCGGANRDGAPAESFEQIRAHSHGQIDIFFDLRKGYPLEKLENFRVYWRYKIGDEVRSASTMFIRQRARKMMYRDEHGNLRSYDYFMTVKDETAGRTVR